MEIKEVYNIYLYLLKITQTGSEMWRSVHFA